MWNRKSIIICLVVVSVIFGGCGDDKKSDEAGVVYNNEGSALAPIDVSVGTVHDGQVDAEQASYYIFEVMTADNYAVDLPNNLVQIFFYGTDSTFNNLVEVNEINSIYGLGLGWLEAGRYYFMVKVPTTDFFTDTTYDLNVTTGTSEGHIAAPVVVVPDVQRTMQVDRFNDSFYQVTLQNHGVYAARGCPDLVSLSSYSDSGYSHELNTSEYGAYRLSDGTYYFKVEHNYGNHPKACNVVFSTLSDGNVSAPLVLALNEKYKAHVGLASEDANESYYRFTTTEAGDYNISAYNAQGYVSYYPYDEATSVGNIDLYLYSDSNLLTEVDRAVGTDATKETLITALDANSTYYLMIHGVQGYNVIFDLNVSTLP